MAECNSVLWANSNYDDPRIYHVPSEDLVDGARTGDMTKIKNALENGAKIDYKCNEPTHPPIWRLGCMTALMFAAHNGHEQVVRHLLSADADKAVTNHLGKTAKDYATEAKHDSIAALL